MARQQDNVLACLQSVPGVGEVVATTFMLELYDPERFQRSEEVASYLGLAPMVRHNGKRKPLPVGYDRWDRPDCEVH